MLANVLILHILYVYINTCIFVLIYNKYVHEPGEKLEFSFLMHEINVLANWTILAFIN